MDNSGDRLPVVDQYEALLTSLKSRIRNSRLTAALAVNREFVLLYWNIGRDILTRQQESGWGAKVIDRLAIDLHRAFPEMKGFSARNLKYMRAFAEIWIDEEFVQQVAAQIPWFHHCVLLDKVKDNTVRAWYVQQTIEHGWSRNVLLHQIESDLFHRQGKAITNFARVLPAHHSDLAQQILKNPYSFDFLTMKDDARERDLERGLLQHLSAFLIEMGMGFALVGNQYHIEVSGKDYYLDLLFYHLRLRCFVVIELKVGEFKPDYTGKMNFYLAAVDQLLARHDDAPIIGMIFCKERDRLTVEYALSKISRPMGVAEYYLSKVLPDELSDNLPTTAALETELSRLSEKVRDAERELL